MPPGKPKHHESPPTDWERFEALTWPQKQRYARARGVSALAQTRTAMLQALQEDDDRHAQAHTTSTNSSLGPTDGGMPTANGGTPAASGPQAPLTIPPHGPEESAAGDDTSSPAPSATSRTVSDTSASGNDHTPTPSASTMHTAPQSQSQESQATDEQAIEGGESSASPASSDDVPQHDGAGPDHASVLMQEGAGPSTGQAHAGGDEVNGGNIPRGDEPSALYHVLVSFVLSTTVNAVGFLLDTTRGGRMTIIYEQGCWHCAVIDTILYHLPCCVLMIAYGLIWRVYGVGGRGIGVTILARYQGGILASTFLFCMVAQFLIPPAAENVLNTICHLRLGRIMTNAEIGAMDDWLTFGRWLCYHSSLFQCLNIILLLSACWWERDYRGSELNLMLYHVYMLLTRCPDGHLRQDPLPHLQAARASVLRMHDEAEHDAQVPTEALQIEGRECEGSSPARAQAGALPEEAFAQREISSPVGNFVYLNLDDPAASKQQQITDLGASFQSVSVIMSRQMTELLTRLHNVQNQVSRLRHSSSIKDRRLQVQDFAMLLLSAAELSNRVVNLAFVNTITESNQEDKSLTFDRRAGSVTLACDGQRMQTYYFHRILTSDDEQGLDVVVTGIAQAACYGHGQIVVGDGCSGAGKTWLLFASPYSFATMLVHILLGLHGQVESLECSFEEYCYQERFDLSKWHCKLDSRHDPTWTGISDVSEFRRLTQQVLRRRRTNKTPANESSSRGNLLFTLKLIRGKDLPATMIQIVDLAGSEDLEGIEDVNEAQRIKLSRLGVGDVLNGLQAGQMPKRSTNKLADRLRRRLSSEKMTVVNRIVCVKQATTHRRLTSFALQNNHLGSQYAGPGIGDAEAALDRVSLYREARRTIEASRRRRQSDSQVSCAQREADTTDDPKSRIRDPPIKYIEIPSLINASAPETEKLEHDESVEADKLIVEARSSVDIEAGASTTTEETEREVREEHSTFCQPREESIDRFSDRLQRQIACQRREEREDNDAMRKVMRRQARR